VELKIDSSDLLKIQDALEKASEYFVKRDDMNASIHLATEPRYSPITSVVVAAFERCKSINESAKPK